MKTNTDPFAGAGVIALDRNEVLQIRGGEWGFPKGLGLALFAMLIYDVLNNFDDFLEAIGEGYDWARAEG